LFVRRPHLSLARGPRIDNPDRPGSNHGIGPPPRSNPTGLPGWHWKDVNTLGEESGDQLRVIDLLALQQ
jgi:hypothetical protein